MSDDPKAAPTLDKSAVSQNALNRHATHHVFILIKDGFGWIAQCAECDENILESRVNEDVPVL